jgi:hypothetical protein
MVFLKQVWYSLLKTVKNWSVLSQGAHLEKDDDIMPLLVTQTDHSLLICG